MREVTTVEIKAETRQKASIGYQGSLGIGVSQGLDSAPDGQDATTQPANRRRERYLRITNARSSGLDARQTSRRRERLFDLDKQSGHTRSQKVRQQAKGAMSSRAIPARYTDTSGLCSRIASVPSDATATLRMQWTSGQVCNCPLARGDVGFHVGTCTHENLHGRSQERPRGSKRREILCQAHRHVIARELRPRALLNR
ncbi:hypothetical protein SAMN05216550_1355 [Paraburkholderia tropica]|jgi:hypothetical protein|uniref:Uncharacterized protein n=1 Tax=Paraburkholderia tropica TaxID=92647 RepID=A0AAQ1GP93_9BURK|nr:hypothetical protein SAMN05216550_1355 [Paraburkholderia tropica]